MKDNKENNKGLHPGNSGLQQAGGSPESGLSNRSKGSSDDKLEDLETGRTGSNLSGGGNAASASAGQGDFKPGRQSDVTGHTSTGDTGGSAGVERDESEGSSVEDIEMESDLEIEASNEDFDDDSEEDVNPGKTKK